MKQCIVCEKELFGNLDTFGPIDLEMCWDCWKQAGDEPEWAGADAIYGLGPHIHTFDENGNIAIGGTKFLPMPEPDAETGLINIEGRYFKPDPEAPGCGTWFRTLKDAHKFEMLNEGLE